MLILRNRQAIYFYPKGWTGFCEDKTICPAGSLSLSEFADELELRRSRLILEPLYRTELQAQQHLQRRPHVRNDGAIV